MSATRRWVAFWSLAILSPALALPAHAGDAPRPQPAACVLQADKSDAPGAATPAEADLGFGRMELVASNVLATQRGSGFSLGIPSVSSSGSAQRIILWDELKAGSRPTGVPSGSGQNVVRITIEPR